MAVSFASAEDFVTEYAENLSVGGLFLRQGHTLPPLAKINVKMTLPGYGEYRVVAKVAHVLDAETAKRFGREPGAGLQLIEVPDGFEEAMMGYLGRLGKRRDCLLLVSEAEAKIFVEKAGYRVEATDLSLVPTQAVGDTPILALIVAKGAAAMYRDVIAISPQKIPVIGCDIRQDAGPLLVELDRLLEAL